MVFLPKNLTLYCIISRAAQAITPQCKHFETVWIFLLRITGMRGTPKKSWKMHQAIRDYYNHPAWCLAQQSLESWPHSLPRGPGLVAEQAHVRGRDNPLRSDGELTAVLRKLCWMSSISAII